MNGVRTYLDPCAPIAPDAIVVDDPKVAMELAVAISPKPRMSNLAHGLWGYHGEHGGGEITVQSLGIGGPSAAAVMTDLAQLGVSRTVRIGSCVALDAARRLGETLVPDPIEVADGTGSALSGESVLQPHRALTAALADACSPCVTGLVRAVDVIPPLEPAGDALALDQSSGAFAATCARAGIEYAEVLVVARAPGEKTLRVDGLEAAQVRLGVQALRALEAAVQASDS